MNDQNEQDYAKLLKNFLKTATRHWKSFHNFKSICCRVMVLQMMVEVVNFRKFMILNEIAKYGGLFQSPLGFIKSCATYVHEKTNLKLDR